MTDDDRHANPPRLREEDLARLADGSLPRAERAAMEARIAGSPELRARLREQERAVALTQSTSGLCAPATLRVSMQELSETSFWHHGRTRSAGRPPAAGRRAALGVLAVTLVAVVSVALHGGRAPTVQRTARLALAAATEPPPSTDPSNPQLLSLHPTGARGIRFPSYVRMTDWRASGMRHDTLDGRQVTTVFYSARGYSARGERAGYSIVSGAALAIPGGITVHGPHGVVYVLATQDGAQLITWRRSGHTCVIASRSVGRRTLLALAAADERI